MKIKNLVLSSTAALALFALSTTVANADSYTVKAGDTVSAIAANYNTSTSAIEKANQLSNINLIFVGDKLEVNGTSTTATATSAAPQSATSQATSSVATSAASQSVTSQATSSVATSAASQSVTSQATSSAATSQATSSVASSQASSQASTATTQQSQAQSSSVTVTSSNTSDSDSAAKAWIANKESGGSYTARNGQYVGKYQLSSSYLNGDYSSANQDRVAEQYVTSRYGSWAAAKNYWVANGSY